MSSVKTIVDFHITPTINSNEIIINVPDATTVPDLEERLFDPTTLQIWTGTGGSGTQLVVTTDYVIENLSKYGTQETGVSIYSRIRIINATYFSTNLYIPISTLNQYGDNIRASDLNFLWPTVPLDWTALNASTEIITNTTVLADGQRVYVDGIVNTSQKNSNYKIGDGATQFQNLPYKLPIYIEISADLDLTASGLDIDGNRLEIYNTDTASHTITLNGSTTIICGAKNKQYIDYNDDWIADIIFLTASDNYTITNKSRKVFFSFTRQATNKTITLRNAIDSINQTFIIKIEGAGVGNVSLIGDNINGITATSWIWYGIGLLKIQSNGSDYDAINNIWDTYKSATELITKYTNKEMVQRLFRVVTADIQTGSGPYWSPAIADVLRTINFSKLYSEDTSLMSSSPSNNLVWLSLYSADESSTSQYRGFYLMDMTSTASQDYSVSYFSTGLWVS